MALRKKHVYLGVIAIGGFALVADRLWTSPETADAAPATESTRAPHQRPAGAKATASSSAALLSIPELHFPRGLPKFDATQPLRDMFAPPARLLDVTQPAAAPVEGDLGVPLDGPTAAGTAERFRGDHQLQAVLVREGLRIAVVDGVWLRVGEELDGCTLREVVGTTAVFECADGETTLRVLEEARYLQGGKH
ncbi:MAG TPA: hypothetical protein PKK06_10990 [Phycisphaerae bacterium]|nr:hypothetical protein [Phycisphaerae bacterium]HNU44341.1 hypothetical protein [Phycisphaerae bacterium]